MKGLFKKGVFITSAASAEGYPNLRDGKGEPLPEIAFVGRSNVGKSSLINYLFNHKGLAKTSQVPGKTQLINFFQASTILLVDLPGYGYAKLAKKERAKWGPMIDAYLTTRKSLKGVVLLLDCRRELNDDDRQFLAWAQAIDLSLLVVFTKCDKLSRRDLLHKQRTLPKELLDLPTLFASTKWAKVRDELGKMIATVCV